MMKRLRTKMKMMRKMRMNKMKRCNHLQKMKETLRERAANSLSNQGLRRSNRSDLKRKI
jgi:hypothetical protein